MIYGRIQRWNLRQVHDKQKHFLKMKIPNERVPKAPRADSYDPNPNSRVSPLKLYIAGITLF